jgi:hypothetical protein
LQVALEPCQPLFEQERLAQVQQLIEQAARGAQLDALIA